MEKNKPAKKKVDRRKTWRKEAKKWADKCPCLECVLRPNCKNLVITPGGDGLGPDWEFDEGDLCQDWEKWNRQVPPPARGQRYSDLYNISWNIMDELERRGLWDGKVIDDYGLAWTLDDLKKYGSQNGK